MLGTGGTSPVAPPIKHFGSIYGETDYQMTGHLLSFGYQFLANQNLNFFGQINYSKSEASFDRIQMVANENTDEALELIESANYDYSEMNTYSDLDYNFLNFRVGAEYRINTSLSFTADLDYYDLKDHLGYVYGVESGSFYVIRTGFRLGGFGW